MHCSGLDVTDHCSAQQTSQEKNFMTVLMNGVISSVLPQEVKVQRGWSLFFFSGFP